MNDQEKIQSQLTQEANENPLHEEPAAFQEFLPKIEEEQLEEVTGGGGWSTLQNLCCFGKPKVMETNIQHYTNNYAHIEDPGKIFQDINRSSSISKSDSFKSNGSSGPLLSRSNSSSYIDYNIDNKGSLHKLQ